MALAVTGALGWSTAQAVEVELVCDQDPRENSAASCMLISPSSPLESAAVQSESQSEPMFVSYYAIEPVSDLSATGGFEWVLDPPLVSYYLSDSASSLSAAADDDWMMDSQLMTYHVIDPNAEQMAVMEPQSSSEPVFVTYYYSIEPVSDGSASEVSAADEGASEILAADGSGSGILIVPSETWTIVQAY